MEHGTITYRDFRLAYEVHGSGPRVTVLLHGLLLDAGVNRKLAEALAADGNRVILLDLLGHGRSDRPRRATHHRMDFYADMVLALLDQLEIDEAVVGGVSLGAGVSLMFGHLHPERSRALVIEMPVLENATPFAALLFVPMLLGMHYGGPVARLATGLIGRLPRTGVDVVDSVLDTGSMHPEEITSVLHGLLMGPLGPTESERGEMHMPALVIGHEGDPLHPATDAQRLARQMPNAQMLDARSMLELRTRPGRLTPRIAAFVRDSWTLRAVGGPQVNVR